MDPSTERNSSLNVGSPSITGVDTNVKSNPATAPQQPEAKIPSKANPPTLTNPILANPPSAGDTQPKTKTPTAAAASTTTKKKIAREGSNRLLTLNEKKINSKEEIEKVPSPQHAATAMKVKK
mmetsp:Transcript_8833/g.13612  ORF Transcript_8833/g.13612 Transcript_8833/m.13612 type:complete len:123 (+) Transcript_8833:1337-1705(+)